MLYYFIYIMLYYLLFYQLIVNKTLSFIIIGNQRLQRQLEGAPDDGHNSAQNMLSAVYVTKQ
jgi:hypothetical protein